MKLLAFIFEQPSYLVAYLLFVVASIVCGGLVFSVRSLFCFAVLCVLSSFASVSLGKRELVALLLLCSECHVAIIAL